MACLNMYNNEQQGYCSVMGPRISFSNDFADAKQALKPESNCYTEAPVSDFEFSLPISPADEHVVPVKENCIPKAVTLRDELLVGDDDDDDFPRLSKSLGWWRIDKLALKRNHHNHHNVGKKSDNGGGLESIDEAKEVCVP